MRIVGAREAAHPTNSSTTGLRRLQDYCVVYSSTRYRALVATWKGWGGQNRREWTQKSREGRYQLRARYSSVPVYLVGNLQQ